MLLLHLRLPHILGESLIIEALSAQRLVEVLPPIIYSACEEAVRNEKDAFWLHTLQMACSFFTFSARGSAEGCTRSHCAGRSHREPR
jgi:hypothetical protein